MPTKITKSNFFWTLGHEVVWNIRDYISSNYDEWIAHSISWFPIVYIETHHKDILKAYHKQPFNYIRRIIQTQDFKEMQNIFSKTEGKTIDYQIRFYQEFLNAFFPYFPSIIKRTGGNEKDEFEFLVKVYNQLIAPNIYSEHQRQMSYNINITTANNTTKDDISRIIKHYGIYLNDKKNDLDKFISRKMNKISSKIVVYQDYTNPTAQKKLLDYNNQLGEFTKSIKDFSRYAGYINKFFNEMINHIKADIQKRASTFKLSNEFKITYLDECNRLVQEL